MEPSPQRPLIALDAVTFRYPKSETDALSGVSLEIPQGSFFALLGPNGAGKTTLLRLLCGRFSRFSGTLNVSVDVRGENGFLDPLACGILLENPGIYPKLSIAEYIDYFVGFYAARSVSWNEAVVRERIASLAKKLELSSLETRMSALSLGNRQKVQLLRAMAPKPRLLILDEPVANLDPVSRETVWSLLADWRKEEGGTAIVCSHILAEMEEEATDFAIIDRGQVLKSGCVADLADDAKSFKVETAAGVTLDQVRAALKNAGIDAAVTPASASLSKLYREIVA
ncbi:MAG: ABC transporter ATP-binding protein [Fibrobacter sp.]|uniref:ABC transporter ATP-binding protein n=1 Tax=Fibrobacter sp. TaxID=35828 RepID=UPI002A90DB43|nr:ABC transporter ATP-binding protein [Fibrobacter sp.]MDY6262961.1 ABC transporter ATP-binding protein [Fibrobacter sp.]